VTEGEGLVQSRGQAVAAITVGDAVVVPPNEYHWHGATSERVMTHLSVAAGEVSWGEHVTDTDCNLRLEAD
jgi:quercetin dioxygenase-like cupin family protein